MNRLARAHGSRRDAHDRLAALAATAVQLTVVVRNDVATTIG
jgi:hypothetical protein